VSSRFYCLTNILSDYENGDSQSLDTILLFLFGVRVLLSREVVTGTKKFVPVFVCMGGSKR